MIYRIKNLEKFIKATIKGICELNGYDKKEIKKYIDKNNIQCLMKKYVYTDTDNEIFISDKDTVKLYDDVREWIVGVELSKIAGQDLIECYWDDENNCMKFYHKSKDSE